MKQTFLTIEQQRWFEKETAKIYLTLDHASAKEENYANCPSRKARAELATDQFIKIISWSIIPYALIIGIFHLLPIKVDSDYISGIGLVIFAAATVWATCYWCVDSVFGRQWTYCATLFNDIGKVDDNLRRRYLKACLANDLLDTKLWAHETFSAIFRLTLEEAVKLQDPAQQSVIRDRIKNKSLTIVEANYLITFLIDDCSNKCEASSDLASDSHQGLGAKLLDSPLELIKVLDRLSVETKRLKESVDSMKTA